MKSNALQIAITKSAQLIALFILTTGISMAAVVYSYIGNIYDSTRRIELSFTTDSLLTNFSGNASGLVTSFSIFDGVKLFTEAETSGRFDLNADTSGNILEWRIGAGDVSAGANLVNVGDTETYISTKYVVGVEEIDGTFTDVCTAKPFGRCITEDFFVATQGARGTWSVSAVPIPATVWLFSSGLLGLVGMSRRKKAA